MLAASNGFTGSYGRSTYSLSAAMIAGTGTAMEVDHDHHATVAWRRLKDPAVIGHSAGERAVRRLHPRKVPSASVAVVFENRLAGSLAGHLIGAVLGSAVARGTSFLKDKLGTSVFRPEISIMDDATMPARPGVEALRCRGTRHPADPHHHRRTAR